MKRTSLVRLVVLVIGLIGGTGAAQAQTLVYSNDFDGGLTVAPGVGQSLTATGAEVRSIVSGFAGHGPAGNQFGGSWLKSLDTQQKTLTLTNLPAHTSVNVGFLLAILDSWDGELFKVTVDGTTRFQENFNYGGGEGTDASNAYQLVMGITGPGLGYPSTGYNFGPHPSLQNIPHTSSTLTVSLQGLTDQSYIDETWAVDNLRISLNGVTESSVVPEPSALALFLPALVALAVVRRRRAS